MIFWIAKLASIPSSLAKESQTQRLRYLHSMAFCAANKSTSITNTLRDLHYYYDTNIFDDVKLEVETHKNKFLNDKIKYFAYANEVKFSSRNMMLIEDDGAIMLILLLMLVIIKMKLKNYISMPRPQPQALARP